MTTTPRHRRIAVGLGIAAAALAATGLAATANAAPDPEPIPPFFFDPITSYPGGLYGGSDVNDFFIANPGGTSYTETQDTANYYFDSSGTPHFSFTPTTITTDGTIPDGGTMATGFYDDNMSQTFAGVGGDTIAQYNTVTGSYDFVASNGVDHFFMGLPTTMEQSITVPATLAAVPPDFGLDPSALDAGAFSSLGAELTSFFNLF